MFIRLAAVDMHTAAHLLEHALSGELARDRTVILVTHHVRLCLPRTAYVAELSDGQIIRAGTPDELDHLGLLNVVIEEEDLSQDNEDVVDEPVQNEADGEEIQESSRHARPITDGKLIDEEARAEGRGRGHVVCVTRMLT
jgi:ABC-type multidrug transport system ATPase subunit